MAALATACRRMAADFVRHAETFDALYERHIPASAL